MNESPLIMLQTIVTKGKKERDRREGGQEGNWG